MAKKRARENGKKKRYKMNENSTFEDIIKKNCVYTIPTYQRDYAWKAENFNELWEDLKESIESLRTKIAQNGITNIYLDWN